MNQKILDDVTSLKQEILKSSEYTTFFELGKQLNQSEEVLRQSMLVDKISTELNDTLKYDAENSEKTKELRHKLFIEKTKLDSIPLVKSYNDAYVKLKEIYSKINDEIIRPLNINIRVKKHD